MNKIEEKSFLEERDNLEENYQVFIYFIRKLLKRKLKKKERIKMRI